MDELKEMECRFKGLKIIRKNDADAFLLLVSTKGPRIHMDEDEAAILFEFLKELYT